MDLPQDSLLLLIGRLVEKLGGEVKLSERELIQGDYEVFVHRDPLSSVVTLQAKRITTITVETNVGDNKRAILARR